MNRSAVLLFGPMMASRRTEWENLYDIVVADRNGPIPSDMAERITVVASGDQLPNAVVDALPALKLVACFSTGYSGIDPAHLRERNIALTTGAGVNAHDVADHAIALLLSLWHGIPAANAKVRHGEWRDRSNTRPSLRGRRAGIVGLGRIGSAIAARLVPHEIDVQWWGPNPKPEAAFERAPSLLALAERSDILIIASAAAPENAGQIDVAVLKALGPGGVLVNVSRGSIVDERALIAALRGGELGGAALDVFEQEPLDAEIWRGIENAVLTPHIAGFTVEGGNDLRWQQMENVRRHFAGEPLLTPVTILTR